MSVKISPEIQLSSEGVTLNLPQSAPHSSQKRRIFNCIWKQATKNIICPSEPRLEGKRALVTGGEAGVGEFISRGLLERGAEVVSMSRGTSQGTGKIDGIQSLNVDLSDPTSIADAVDHLRNTHFDLVICNAGVVSKQYIQSKTGLENTFAVNVLGHHILYRLLIERDLLNIGARIIMTTGEIYISEVECSANIPFDNTHKTYARSKLGNLWQASELNQRYPNLFAASVHPGVIASGFSGSKTGLLAQLRKKLLISEGDGAAAALIAATQDLPRGAYWHNVMGIVNLPENDPAKNNRSASKLWDQLETLAKPFLV